MGIEQARRQSPEAKLAAGIDLFCFARELMLAGIRAQFPEANDEQVHGILRERLALARRLEQV